MNNKEFISQLANKTGLSNSETSALVNSLISSMSDHLEDNDTIALQGFGIFEVKKKNERVMVNPSNKQRILVPPKMVINFKSSPVLKNKMQETQD